MRKRRKKFVFAYRKYGIIFAMAKLIKKIPHVAIFLDTSQKTLRELLQGFLRYVYLHGPWSVRLYEDTENVDMSTQTFSGAFGHLAGTELFHRLNSQRVPVIFCDQMTMPAPRARSARVLKCANAPIAEAAATYFLERGYTHFAYVGSERLVLWSEERRIAFTKCLACAGKTCKSHKSSADGDLAAFLASLPHPSAVFVANDARGRNVLDACHEAGVSVPQDIAVLSCDNDELICETASPPLSSIQFDTERAGYLAAEALDGLMRGGPMTKEPILYGFSGIVTRYSSEGFLVPDKLVEHAFTYIRLNAMSPLPVASLVAELHVSRRLLEKRFLRATGRTIHKEIMRVRLERVCSLLNSSDMSIESIAEDCCFPSANHLCVVFKRHFGVTPSAWRRRNP